MAEIRRQRGTGKPYIIPPESDSEVLYFRSSKLASALDDSYGLDLWHQRNVALGIADNTWLLDEIRDNREEPKELDALCTIARDKAGENLKNSWGTVVHWFTECIDNEVDWEDEDPPDDVMYSAGKYGSYTEDVNYSALDEAGRYEFQTSMIAKMYELAADDLDAYQAAMEKYGIRRIMAERFCVNDEIKAAGTLDGLYTLEGFDGNLIGDLKTGRADDLGALKFAMQLAIYANSVLYELNEDGTVHHEQIPNVSRQKALLIHLPMLQGRCDISWVDVEYGWEAVLFAMELRDKRRKGKKTMRSIDLPDPVRVPALPEDTKTIAQLREFAKEFNIPLNGATKKDDIRAAVIAAEGEIFE